MTSPLLACVLALAAPQDLRGEIEVSPTALAVSPSGELWIGGGDGRLFVSCDWNGSWNEVELGPHRSADGQSAGEELTHICFFDGAHALAAGRVGLETKNELLRTEDGGRTWLRVALGVPHGLTVRVSDMQVDADGHAWLAASTGVLVSSVFGASWHYVAAEPFEGAARSTSLCFATQELGLVGADGNALSLTRDGGRTWSWMATPVDELYPGEARERQREPAADFMDTFRDDEERWRAERERRVAGVHCLGERWIVLQRGQLFQRAFDGDGPWRELPGLRRVVGLARDAARLLVLTDDRRLTWLSSELEPSPACGAPLEGDARVLACGERGAAFLTMSGRLCTLRDGALACSLPLYPLGAPPRWPVVAFDRTLDGLLFGVSENALYRSADSGRSWERLAEGEWLHDVLVARDGSSALLLGDGRAWRWSAGAKLASALAGEKPLHQLTVHARIAGLWLASAFEAAEDEETQVMLETSDTVLVGPGFRTLLFASRDEGEHWRRIAEHPGAIVHALWYGDDGLVRVCLSDGTLRSGRIDARDATLVGGELALLSPADQAYGGDWATWLAFSDGDHGWVGGNRFFEGASLARTSDGGRTWTPIDSAPHEWTEAFRLGGGGCVKVAGLRHPGSRVELGRGGEFHELRRFETPVHDARVDAGGRLLVRLTNDEVWSLAADGGAWSLLSTIPVPPR